jgi:hypothetical protein
MKFGLSSGTRILRVVYHTRMETGCHSFQAEQGEIMKRKPNTMSRSITLVIPFLLLCAIAISAQMDRQLARSQQENGAALKKYEWK